VHSGFSCPSTSFRKRRRLCDLDDFDHRAAAQRDLLARPGRCGVQYVRGDIV
jgi:hypothetical protein